MCLPRIPCCSFPEYLVADSCSIPLLIPEIRWRIFPKYFLLRLSGIHCCWFPKYPVASSQNTLLQLPSISCCGFPKYPIAYSQNTPVCFLGTPLIVLFWKTLLRIPEVHLGLLPKYPGVFPRNTFCCGLPKYTATPLWTPKIPLLLSRVSCCGFLKYTFAYSINTLVCFPEIPFVADSRSTPLLTP